VDFQSVEVEYANTHLMEVSLEEPVLAAALVAAVAAQAAISLSYKVCYPEYTSPVVDRTRTTASEQ
jgi:hypothetical protein